MFIHTVAEAETLYEIARKYGVPPTKIIDDNGLDYPDKISAGQKLVIAVPTRTYTARGADTAEKIANRFKIPKRALLRQNPSLMGKERTYPEQILSIKQEIPKHGCILLNGYAYSGCTLDKLEFAIPYVNFVTVCAYCATEGGIRRIYDDTPFIEKIKSEGRYPIARIYDAREYADIVKEEDGYINLITEIAKEKGYRGVTLAAFAAQKDNKFPIFAERLKNALNENGIKLFTEADGLPIQEGDFSDGRILMYEKCHLKDIPTFQDGEQKFYTEYAECADASKTFMDISSFAYAKNECMTKYAAQKLAYDKRCKINYDEKRKICYFNYRTSHGKEGEVRVAFESCENIKAKFDLIYELGFLGMSFDIMRLPIEYLVMCTQQFVCGMDCPYEI